METTTCRRCHSDHGDYSILPRSLGRRVILTQTAPSALKLSGPYCRFCGDERSRELLNSDKRSKRNKMSEVALVNVYRDDCCLVSVQAAFQALGKRIARSRVEREAKKAGYRPNSRQRHGMYSYEHLQLMRACGLNYRATLNSAGAALAAMGMGESKGHPKNINELLAQNTTGVFIVTARSTSGSQHAMAVDCRTQKAYNSNSTWCSARLIECLEVSV